MAKNHHTPIRIDKGPNQAKERRILRQKILQGLNIENDERQIDLLVSRYLQRAKSSGEKAANNNNKPEDVRKFLADALALFLLASEPPSRASKLEAALYPQRPINKHEETTLLALVLKTFGPYSHNGRRMVHRDSVALQFIVHLGITPDDLPAYLAKRGQGIDSTYRHAQNFFNAHKPEYRQKYQLVVEPKAQAQLARRVPNTRIVGLLDERGTGFVMTSCCVVDGATVRAVIEFVNRMLKKKKGSKMDT